MRYFVQPFDHFGEDVSQQFSPEFYMHALAKVSHIKEFLALDSWGKPFSEKTYKETCASYRGCYGSEWGMCVKPGGELEIEYDIFKTKIYGDDGRYWSDSCKLKIWLTKQDVFKIMKI
jgi:hypothetical protein